eukprot:gene17958-21389_t
MLQRVVRAEAARFLAETEAGNLRDQLAQLEATAEGNGAEERRLARRRRASLDTPVVYSTDRVMGDHFDECTNNVRRMNSYNIVVTNPSFR